MRKLFKNQVKVLFLNTDAGILDRNRHHVPRLPRSYRDVALFRELGGVTQEVHNDLPNFDDVGRKAWKAGRNILNEVEVLGLHKRLDSENTVRDHRSDIFCLETKRHPARFNLGEVENIVDELQQMPAILQHLFGGHLLVLGKRLWRIWRKQDGAESDNGVQWRTQLVRHAGQKIRFDSIRLFQL